MFLLFFVCLGARGMVEKGVSLQGRCFFFLEYGKALDVQFGKF